MPDSYISRLISAHEANAERVSMRIVGDQGQVYTFGESLAAIRSIAYRLGESGIEKGDRIALIGENHPCWAMAYLGILYAGAVCVPLDPDGGIDALTNFLDNSEARLAFVSSSVLPKFIDITQRLGRPIQYVVWDARSEPAAAATGVLPAELPDSPGAAPAGSDWKRVATAAGSDFADWISGFPAEFAQKPPDIGPDDNALLIYTSGTTGNPKGVPLTHGNIIAELIGIDEVLRFTDRERILSLLPLFHAYLQIVNLWVASTVGCEVGYLKELSPAELSSAMKEFKPTILTTVPRLWYLFHKKIFDAVAARPGAVRAIFRSMLAVNGRLRNTLGVNLGKKFFKQVHDSFGGELRIAVSAGSRFDEAVAEDFHHLGFTIIQGYGLTETSGAATATFETDNRIGSVGKPMRGTEIKINEPDADGVGEVLIRGGVVFNGYYRNPAATADAFTDDGWFRSGDLGKLDADGHLYIVGRAKDVIVLPSGKNVHPEDLEVHYLKAPAVAELAIVGIRDESESRAGAERLAAVVVPDFEYLKQANVANSKEAVRYQMDDLGRELPEYQRVRDYMIRIEPLPRTATRKIKRFELKKAIEEGTITRGSTEQRSWELAPADSALLGSAVGRAVITAVRQNLKEPVDIHPDMNLEIDLGLDSLARAETFAALEHAFAAEFEADEAARALTVRDAIALVEKHAANGATAAETSAAELNWSKIVKHPGDNIPEVDAALRERPLFSAFAFSVYKAFNFFCRLALRLEVRGQERFRQMERPFLICPNHQSFLDPFIVCSTYPFEFFRATFHVGAAGFFQGRIMQFVARMLNVVPVDPDTQLMRAMRAGAMGLKRGRILNIYPEGERAYDGDLHEFKKGAAILATELDLPIVPVALDGLHKVWARRSMKIRPGKVKVWFGRPFYAKDIIAGKLGPGGAAADDDEKYAVVTRHLKTTVADMIAAMRRGEEFAASDAASAHPASLPAGNK
jgi:long-chain acyl-CoA synthetase